MSTTSWTQKNTVEEALALPEGRYSANFGFHVEQRVQPEHTAEAAEAFIGAGKEVKFYSQAQLIVEAQNQELCFQTWAPIETF